MVDFISIKNFKTIEDLRLDCKRVNVIIGAPNSGKTNVLEALSLLSRRGVAAIRDMVRIENAANLFPNNDLTHKIEISANDIFVTLFFDGKNISVDFSDVTDSDSGDKSGSRYSIEMDEPSAPGPNSSPEKWEEVKINKTPFRFYRYTNKNNLSSITRDHLVPPFGSNLVQLLYNYKELRKSVSHIFADSGYKLVIIPNENRLMISKEDDDNLILLPYKTLSDTYKRLIFYKCILEQSKGAAILLDEPEAFMFPGNVKYLAERIGGNEGNQFFIVTHNPYMLTNLIEKTNKDDLTVSIAYQKDGKTKLKTLKGEQIVELVSFGEDAFFNLGRYYDDEYISRMFPG